MRQIYYISLNINVLCYFKDLCLQVVVVEKDWFISVEKLFDVLVTAEIFLCTLHPAKTNIYVSSDIYICSMTDLKPVLQSSGLIQVTSGLILGVQYCKHGSLLPGVNPCCKSNLLQSWLWSKLEINSYEITAHWPISSQGNSVTIMRSSLSSKV